MSRQPVLGSACRGADVTLLTKHRSVLAYSRASFLSLLSTMPGPNTGRAGAGLSKCSRQTDGNAGSSVLLDAQQNAGEGPNGVERVLAADEYMGLNAASNSTRAGAGKDRATITIRTEYASNRSRELSFGINKSAKPSQEENLRKKRSNEH